MSEIQPTNIGSALGKIALFGAGGAIGKSTAQAMRARGLDYRVVGRDQARLDAAFGSDPHAESAVWDPNDPHSVRAAAEGVDTLIYLVGVPYHRNDLHPILMQRTVDGAASAGVKRFALIGTVYPYGVPTTPTVAETHPRDPKTFKGRMRKQQEDILLQAHAERNIQGTILRLPDFYGPDGETSFLHRVFQAAARGGAADMIGPIDTPHEFVYTPDVGPVVLDLAARPEAYGRGWNFAGVGAITQREAARQIFELAGRPPKLRVIGKNGLRLMGLFNPLMREMVEMHYLQTTPVLLDDRALSDLIGPLRKTTYAEGFRQTLDAYRASARLPEGAPREASKT